MSRTSELVVFKSGGDWADASVEVLKVPLAVDLSDERKKYREWYSKVYLSRMHSKERPNPYYSFTTWLSKFCKATEPTEAEIEVIDEDY